MDILKQIDTVNTILDLGYNVSFEKQMQNSKVYCDEIKFILMETGGYDRIALIKTRLRLLYTDTIANRMTVELRANNAYYSNFSDDVYRALVKEISNLPVTEEYRQVRLLSRLIRSEKLFSGD